MYTVIQFLHEQIHVVPAPIVARQGAAAAPVSLVCGVVRKGDFLHLPSHASRLGIRIEVVVHVDAIDVIPSHEIEDDLLGPLSHRGLARIHPLVGPVLVH